MNGSRECPICLPLLKEKIKELAESFNISLLKPTKSDPHSNEDQPEDENEQTVNARPPSFYKSTEWDSHVQETIASFPSISQPTLERKLPQLNQENLPRIHSQRKCSHCHQPGHTRSINGVITCPQLLGQVTLLPTPAPAAAPAPTPAQHLQDPRTAMPQQQVYVINYVNRDSLQFWFFPIHLSQSTINGRQGSTACALIALLMAHKYHNQKSSLAIQRQLSPAWFTLMVSSIIEGNSVHDDIFNHTPITLQIPMASSLLAGRIPQIRLGQELPANFTSEDGPSSSNLDHYLKEMVLNSTSLSPSAIVVTFRGNTFSFVPGKQNNLIFLDSHLHHPFGALIASVPVTALPELLKWIRTDYLQSPYNLCTLTAIYF